MRTGGGAGSSMASAPGSNWSDGSVNAYDYLHHVGDSGGGARPASSRHSYQRPAHFAAASGRGAEATPTPPSRVPSSPAGSSGYVTRDSGGHAPGYEPAGSSAGSAGQSNSSGGRASTGGYSSSEGRGGEAVVPLPLVFENAESRRSSTKASPPPPPPPPPEPCSTSPESDYLTPASDYLQPTTPDYLLMEGTVDSRVDRV